MYEIPVNVHDIVRNVQRNRFVLYRYFAFTQELSGAHTITLSHTPR